MKKKYLFKPDFKCCKCGWKYDDRYYQSRVIGTKVICVWCDKHGI